MRSNGSATGGGFTADESRAATTLAKQIRERFDPSALSDAAINQAVGALFGRGDFTEQDIIAAAFQQDRGNINLNPRTSVARLSSRLNVINRRDKDALDAFFKREKTQKKESLQEAGKQATAVGGPTSELERIVRKSLGPGASEDEIKRTMANIRLFGTSGGLRKGIEEAQSFGFLATRPLTTLVEAMRGQTTAVPTDELGRLFEDPVTLAPVELSNLMTALRAIERGPSSRQNNITINNNQHQRHLGPDAASRNRRVRGGGNLADVRRNEVR